jgi:catechol 2,3-dioxygenase-like lactoylglutathione lyase family enzyme
MSEDTTQFSNLTPILRVSNFSASMRYYTEQLGFQKVWEWGEPPGFGCVRRDSLELFLCLNGQGQPGTWISFFVSGVDSVYEELRERGAKISKPPNDEPWGMREFHVEDPDGHTFRIGEGISKKDFRIKRTPLEARVEERLAAVLADLANATNRTVGEVLEETLLHSFEPVPNCRGAVASPHTPATFRLIDTLKKKHGLDYETHANYRFTED